MGAPVVLFKDKINFKMPGGAGFKAHQDQQAGWTCMRRFRHCHGDARCGDMENGCLELSAGRHREGLIGEQWKPAGGAGLEPAAGADRARGCDFLRQLRSACLEAQFERIRRGEFSTSPTTWPATAITGSVTIADKHASFPPDIDRDREKTYVFRV